MNSIDCFSSERIKKNIPNSGTYILEIKTIKNINISYHDNEYSLKRGYYYYSGSAQKNMPSRLLRHINKDKKLHWNIDFLTTNKNATIKRIFILVNAQKEKECFVISKILEIDGAFSPIKKFGSNDCKSCYSHLIYSKNRISQSHFSDLYHSMVCFIPSSREIS